MTTAHRNETAIRLNCVSKKYRVYFEKPAIVRSLLPFLSSGPRHHEFWALRDVHLEIKRGECVGFLGPNGAGKSTILSVLAGITEPSMGSVEINGRISALLSLGAGFQPELTGRENIYLNAAILGMKRFQVDELFERIVDYAGIGEFMDAKLSTYSSGMNMRLGFAIAVNVPFDILLIDEMLSVGDLEFQQKCFKTMRDFTEDEDRTIIFVSHDIGRIEEMCDRAVWLEHGRIEEMDSAEVVVRQYRGKYRQQQAPFVFKKRRQREMEAIHPAHMVVDASKTLRKIPSSLFGANIDWLSEGRNVWNQRRKRFNTQVVEEMENFRFNLLRFPGGHHADFYHWKGATGDARTEQLNGGTREKEFPYFGPEEYIALCRQLGAGSLLTANAFTGTADEIVEWLEYSKSRGLPVKYVEIGHEPYGNEHHPLGQIIHMTPEEYAAVFLKFAKAIHASDKEVKLIACGCFDTGVIKKCRFPDWNRIVLEKAGDLIDFISLHSAHAPIWNITPEHRTPSFDVSFEALMAAPLYVMDNLRRVGEQVASLGKKCKLAVTDYCADYLDIPRTLFGEIEIKGREPRDLNMERNTTIGTALYEAMLLNLFMKDPRIEIANRNFIHNPIYPALLRIDAMGVTRNAQYYMHRLYNRMAGKQLVWSDIEVASYRSEAIGVIPPQEKVPYLDHIALIDEDRSRLTIFLVNRNLAHHIQTRINLRGFDFTSALQVHLNSPEFDSRNEHPADQKIWFTQTATDVREITNPKTGRIRITVPKHSLVALILSRDKWL
ncbi:MAG: ATP-binding cassette domain-containing protein [Candidatus Aureabacteria bacterium]|nr:ATP-binding cassette domain-containing protein [Candidatus Auribacterota bacterium]